VSLGFDVEVEHAIGGLKFDVVVPSARLAIEFQGLHWHSAEGSQTRDFKKFALARSLGYGVICLYEDEWHEHRHKIENLLRSRLGVSRPVRWRGSKCTVSCVSSADADAFHDSYHYIGAARCPVNYGVFVEGNLVACASFRRPTRQSKYQYELARMSSCPNITVHGAWSKVMQAFAFDHKPESVVSFSDDRLFDGLVYGKIGFRRDGKVKPDYYWTDGKRRWHKSSMRKRGTERTSGKTEGQLRSAVGLCKIWDLGKTRWVWPHTSNSVVKEADRRGDGRGRSHV
jgi:hypothetical protein